MKRPKYKLACDIKEKDDLEFKAGTEIQVFWNDFFVPDHRKEELDEKKKIYRSDGKRLYMCIIGRHWVVLDETQIREER